MNSSQKESRKTKRAGALLLLLVALLLLIFWSRCSPPVELEPEQPAGDLKEEQKSEEIPLSSDVTSSELFSSLEPSSSSREIALSPAVSSQALSSAIISAKEAAPPDTIPPELFVDPPSGRFYGEVEVLASCDEPRCTASLFVGEREPGESDWKSDRVKLLPPGGAVWAVAVDSVGNRSPIERRDYQVVQGTPQCGEHAVPVETKEHAFCIDQFEWPNQPGALPMGAVSQQAAADSCAAHNKRLCTLNEWQSACLGPQQTLYPYGTRYIQRNCYTAEKGAGRSGRKKSCRSWYGVYDLAGNLWEWTSTENRSHPGRFEVAGGSWGAGDRSSCRDTKWSFFPQNEYPIIGFRCCAPLRSKSSP